MSIRPAAAGGADGPLGPEWLDHRECHGGGDFLLIYRLSEAGPNAPGIVVFTRADLFEE